MSEQDQRDWTSRLRTILKNSWMVLVIVAVYVGLIFYSRHEENVRIEERAAARKRAEAARTVALMGGNEFKILNFYASPGAIRRGDTVELCYGVSNASSVAIVPKVEGVWPALSHCVEISPEKTTTYTLTAKDASGKTQTATLTVTVVGR